mgnify:CR=1 FL=1
MDTIVWKNIFLEGQVTESAGFPRDEEFSVLIDQVSLRIKDPITQTFVLKVSGFRSETIPLEKIAEGAQEKIGKEDVLVREFSIAFQLTSLDPDRAIPQLKDVVAALERFMKQGRTAFPVSLSGEVGFVYKKKYGQGRIYIEREGAENILVMDKGDVKGLCRMMGEEVWNEEVDVAYRWPARVPRLIQIRDYARTRAHEVSAQRSDVPEKAYRHVLWSYLLTGKYGAAFAKEATSAHELYQEPEERVFNIEPVASHQMDMANDGVGARYAESGYPEDGLAEHMINDPEVIFYPGGPRGQKLSPEENRNTL